jgi:uncharacterized protein YprB with RNaseH-like and TPR domain
MERSVEQIKKNTFPLSDNNSESKKFLFFDTETTGLPKSWNAAVDILATFKCFYKRVNRNIININF